MTVVNEGPFHLLMGALLFASTFLDRAMRSVLPAWDPPSVGLLTLVLGLVWVGMFAAHRLRLQGDRLAAERDRLAALTERVERGERRLQALAATRDRGD